MFYLLRKTLRIGVVSLIGFCSYAVVAEDPLPLFPNPIASSDIVPIEHAFSIVVFADAAETDVNTATSPDNVAAALNTTVVYSWDELLQIDTLHSLDAIIIHESAVDSVDRVWLTEGFWDRPLIISGLNIDRPQLFEMIGLGHCSADPLPDWASAGRFFLIRSRLVVADFAAEAQAYSQHLRQSCGDANLAEHAVTGYLADLDHTWYRPLETVDDLHLFASLIVQDIQQFRATREAHAMGTLQQPPTLDEITKTLSSLGLRVESIIDAIREIYR